MIEITLFYRADGALAGYEFSGHAGAAPYGEDLVCASASTLAIVTANSLETQGANFEAEMDEGYLKLMLTPARDERGAIVAEAVLKTLEVGVSALAQDYKEYIKANSIRV